jgi:hypothetical protein
MQGGSESGGTALIRHGVASDSLTVAARFYDVVWRLFRLESDGGRFRIAACWGSTSGDVG